jgi:hypothetical protein
VSLDNHLPESYKPALDYTFFQGGLTMKILRFALVLGLLCGCADFEGYVVVPESYGEGEYYEAQEETCPQVAPSGQFAPLTPVPMSPTGPPSPLQPAGHQTQEPPF